MEAIFSTDIFRWGSFILHSLGVAIGAGGAYLSDAILFASLRNHVISKSEIKFIRLGGLITMTGLLLLIVSGVSIFLTAPEQYLDTPKFLAKMVIVGVLTVNGCLLHWKLVPIVERHIPSYLPHELDFMRASRLMFACGAISVTSWTFSLALGSMRGFRGDLMLILTLYFCTLCGGVLISQRLRKHLLFPVKNTHGHEVLPPGDYTPLTKK